MRPLVRCISGLITTENQPQCWEGRLDRYHCDNVTKANVHFNQQPPALEGFEDAPTSEDDKPTPIAGSQTRPPLPPSKAKRRIARQARDAIAQAAVGGNSNDPNAPIAVQAYQAHGTMPNAGNPWDQFQPTTGLRRIKKVHDPSAPQPPPDTQPVLRPDPNKRGVSVPMTPHRQQPMRPLKIAAYGLFLKNAGRRTYLPNGVEHIHWLDDRPGELIPSEMPNEVIFGDRDQPQAMWTILRIPEGMHGSRARWVNKTQSGHQRKVSGLKFGQFPRDATTDPHLAQSDFYNLWHWARDRWERGDELANAVFWLDPTAEDPRGMKRDRIHVTEANRWEYYE